MKITAFEETTIEGEIMYAPDLQCPVKQKQYVFSSIAIECPEYHGCPEEYTLQGNRIKSMI